MQFLSSACLLILVFTVQDFKVFDVKMSEAQLNAACSIPSFYCPLFGVHTNHGYAFIDLLSFLLEITVN